MIVPPLWIANVLGWIVAHKRQIAIAAGIVLVLLIVIGIYRGCDGKPAKLNEAEIQAGERAVKDRNDAELKRILTESDAREAVIDANIANADREKVNAIYEAKKKYVNMNTAELQAEFDRRANGQ